MLLLLLFLGWGRKCQLKAVSFSKLFLGDTYIWPGKEFFFSTLERVVYKNIKNIPFDEIHNVSEIVPSGSFFQYVHKIFRRIITSYNLFCWGTYFFCFIDSKDSLILFLEHFNVIKKMELCQLAKLASTSRQK